VAVLVARARSGTCAATTVELENHHGRDHDIEHENQDGRHHHPSTRTGHDHLRDLHQG
jgi:hypothetical protein